MAWPFIATSLLAMLLVGKVASNCGNSTVLVDPCHDGKPVIAAACVSEGTNLTVICDIEDTSAAWISSKFESALITSSVPNMIRLNDMVDIRFLNRTDACFLSSATIQNVPPLLDGLDLFCGSSAGKSGANITVFIAGDIFANVTLIGIDLTRNQQYVDFQYFDIEDCQFDHLVISNGSCEQHDVSAAVATFGIPTAHGRAHAHSFPSLCISACTKEESNCICQEFSFDNFSVTPSQEVVGQANYSLTLSFVHEVAVRDINQPGNGGSCSATVETSKTVVLFCSALLNATSYTLILQGQAKLSTDEFVNLDFEVVVSFTTSEMEEIEEAEDGGLSGGEIAGIVILVISAVVVVAIVAVFVVIILIRKKSKASPVPVPQTVSVPPTQFLPISRYNYPQATHVGQESPLSHAQTSYDPQLAQMQTNPDQCLAQTQTWSSPQFAPSQAGSGPAVADIQSNYIDNVLKRGHVPPLPKNLVSRKLLLEQVRDKLHRLKDNDGWVVIHGLPGFGKTLLAIDAVSDASLLQDVFPGGVFWLSVGKMSSSSGEISTAMLLEKVQNFIARMDKLRHRPPNLESATDYLQEVMMEQYPRSLLILDDVWEEDTADVFAVRCRTLVTTRNAVVANGINTPDVYPVSVMEGLGEEDGLQLLSLSIKKPVEQLPGEAASIINLCHGSPMSLNIIGAMLQRYETPERWEDVMQRLKRERAGTLTGQAPGRKRPLRERRGKMEESLNTSIALTEEVLTEEIRDCFHQLAVFDYDSDIPTAALATIWGMTESSAEETMLEIVSWSLTQQAQHQQPDGRYPSFIIHDIILEYLKTTIDKQELKSYHGAVVDRYFKKAGDVWSDIVCDSYCHRRLMSHMADAGRITLLGELLTDLRWVAACCRCWDANSLLASYTTFKACLSKTELWPVLEQFQTFISSHLNILSRNLSTESVVQLALAQSRFQEVACRAETVARSEASPFWLKNMAPDLQLVAQQLTPHSGKVRQCRYYDKGSKVVSCSSHSVKLWQAETGKVLATFSEHTNQITDCAISENGEVLVCCSDDCISKVWDVKKHSVLLNFDKHSTIIENCDMTEDGRLVVTGDLNSCVMVWEARNGAVLSSWTHSQMGITSVAFSSTGNCVVVGSQDGLVRLTNIQGVLLHLLTLPVISIPLEPISAPSLSREYTHGASRSSTGSKECPIYSCVFSADGELVAAASYAQARIWTVKDGKCTFALIQEKNGIHIMSVEFSPDKRQLVIGYINGTVQVLSLEGSQVRSLEGSLSEVVLPLHWDAVSCIRYSPQETHILSLSFSTGLIKIIHCNSLKQPKKLYHRRFKLYRRRFSVHFAKEGMTGEYSPTILCYNMWNRRLEVCEGLDGSAKHVLATPSNLVPRSWQISLDGTAVIVGYGNGALQLMELKTSRQFWINESAHNGEVFHCLFSPDGSKIISCGKDCYHKVWSFAEGKALSSLSDCIDFTMCPCVFFDDNNRVASAQLGKVLVWDSSSGSVLFSCKGISPDPTESILFVGISKDNSRLVASAANGVVAVWCAKSGKLLFTGSHGQSARSCALNRDGSVVAVGHDDCTLKIYYVNKEGRQVVTKANSSAVAWMVDTQFSPDDSQIITLSDSIQWWSINGKCQKMLFLKNASGKYVRFSPDFKTFVTIDNLGHLYVLTVLKTPPT